MQVIGLTGGVGAGKSTVMEILKKQYGAYLIEADAVGRKMMAKGGVTYGHIVEAFGGEILDDTGEIDRARLAAIAFAAEQSIQRLNACTHPYIMAAITEEIEKIRREGNYPLLVLEAAIPKEAHLKELCDTVWYIYVPWEVRKNRIMESRGYSGKRAEEFMKRQPSEEEYRILADAVIENTGSLEETALQVRRLLQVSNEKCRNGD